MSCGFVFHHHLVQLNLISANVLIDRLHSLKLYYRVVHQQFVFDQLVKDILKFVDLHFQKYSCSLQSF